MKALTVSTINQHISLCLLSANCMLIY